MVTIIDSRCCFFFQKKKKKLDIIISKDGEYSGNVKIRIAKAQNVFSQLENLLNNKKISLQTKIRIFEALAMTVVKYSSEAWVLQKTVKDLPYAFKRNYLWTVMSTRLTDRISNSSFMKNVV